MSSSSSSSNIFPNIKKYNYFTKLFYRKKSKYYQQFTKTLTTSSSKLWKKLQPYISPNKKRSINSYFILKEENDKSDLHLSNKFCNYFSSICNLFSFLPINLCLSSILKHFNTIAIFLDLKSKPSFSLCTFNTDEIIKELKLIPNKIGKGEVNIDAIIFSECAEALGKVICELFNSIISTGVYPDEWKCAHITPIYKGQGSKSELESYRPISIISPISKLFESLIAKQMIAYLESNKLIHESQFAYRKKKSCELDLNTMISDWKDWLENKNDVISVFLDLSKAFDTVDHELLIAKLHYYNFDLKTINLLKNYLNNRSIKVNINGTLSNTNSLKTGIPQGSVLGPLFFVLYVNDLLYLDIQSKPILFADDTTISTFGKKVPDIINKLVEDMDKINKWLQNNRLIINFKKTKAMYICHSDKETEKHKKSVEKELVLSVNNEIINFTNEVKILGVIVDNKLKFKAQTVNICKKVNSKAFQLAKSLYLFTDKFRPNLFKIFIQPHFDYCSTLIQYLPDKTNRARLDTCFAKTVRRILKINIYKSAIEKQYELLKEHNILPLQYRLFFRFCTFVFNIKKNNNSSLCSKLHKNNPTNRHGYSLPKANTNFEHFSFIYISLKLLNEFIDERLEKQDSILNFKKFLHMNIITLFSKSQIFWIKPP